MRLESKLTTSGAVHAYLNDCPEETFCVAVIVIDHFKIYYIATNQKPFMRILIGILIRLTHANVDKK